MLYCIDYVFFGRGDEYCGEGTSCYNGYAEFKRSYDFAMLRPCPPECFLVVYRKCLICGDDREETTMFRRERQYVYCANCIKKESLMLISLTIECQQYCQFSHLWVERARQILRVFLRR